MSALDVTKLGLMLLQYVYFDTFWKHALCLLNFTYLNYTEYIAQPTRTIEDADLFEDVFVEFNITCLRFLKECVIYSMNKYTLVV